MISGGLHYSNEHKDDGGDEQEQQHHDHGYKAILVLRKIFHKILFILDDYNLFAALLFYLFYPIMAALV